MESPPMAISEYMVRKPRIAGIASGVTPTNQLFGKPRPMVNAKMNSVMNMV